MSENTDPSWLRLSMTLAGGQGRRAQELEDGVRARLDHAGITTIVEEDETTMGGEDLAPGQKRLVVYLEEDAAATADTLRSQLERYALDFVTPGVAQPLSVQLDAFTDTGWRDAWKAYFKPAIVSPRLAVRAPWAELETPEGVHVLVIEPGMAFGTGLHETTRLCMAALDNLIGDHPPARMLDVGCGSGVLSIAGYMLGVRDVVGVDVDPIAAEVSAENAVFNQTRGEFSTTPCAQVPGQFPLVVANILSHILLSLREALLERTAPGGKLLLSGLLGTEEEKMLTAFTDDGRTRLIRTVRLGEWSCLELERLP